MSRSRRMVIPDQPLHVIQRGNNRMTAFLDPSDFNAFLSMLRTASEKYGCAIHAYVLMANHFHLLLTPGNKHGASRLMQSVEVSYVRYFNDRYRRTGTLWEGRFRSSLIESNRYFHACSRYIEMNPVRALIVQQPSAYAWSSFHHNAMSAADALVTPHALYVALGNRARERRLAYQHMFKHHLDPDVCDVIRKAANAGTPLGGAAFEAHVEAVLHRKVQRASHGGDRRSEAFAARLAA